MLFYDKIRGFSFDDDTLQYYFYRLGFGYKKLNSLE